MQSIYSRAFCNSTNFSEISKYGGTHDRTGHKKRNTNSRSIPGPGGEQPGNLRAGRRIYCGFEWTREENKRLMERAEGACSTSAQSNNCEGNRNAEGRRGRPTSHPKEDVSVSYRN